MTPATERLAPSVFQDPLTILGIPQHYDARYWSEMVQDAGITEYLQAGVRCLSISLTCAACAGEHATIVAAGGREFKLGTEGTICWRQVPWGSSTSRR